MRKIFFIFAVILFASCTQKPLQLSDLKFNALDDYLVFNSKEALIANRVDTMFLIQEKDTIEFYVYDENGQIVEAQQICFMGSNNKYKYDSIGFLIEQIHDSDYYEALKMSYRFEPNSLMLYREYYGECRDSTFSFYGSDYTLQFKFDKQGKVLEKKRSDYKTIYKYNQSEQLIEIQTFQEDSIMYGYQNYFYSNNKLDSVVSCRLIVEVLPKTMYYDDRGLCYRIIKYGVNTDCIYKQRK